MRFGSWKACQVFLIRGIGNEGFASLVCIGTGKMQIDLKL